MVELRRRIPRRCEGRDVFVYVSHPVKELRGGFRVGQVWEGAPGDVWEIVSDRAGVDGWEFDDYFRGRAVAYALEVTDVWEYPDAIALTRLRERFEKFQVPQSWRYAKPEELDFLHHRRLQNSLRSLPF